LRVWPSRVGVGDFCGGHCCPAVLIGEPQLFLWSAVRPYSRARLTWAAIFRHRVRGGFTGFSMWRQTGVIGFDGQVTTAPPGAGGDQTELRGSVDWNVRCLRVGGPR
jgi:hypothetical protein